MNEFFLAALSFGLASGVKPGPLGILVIQQTLSRGLAAGVQASMAPLITDGPIILAALLLLSNFKNIDQLAAAMSLAGGLYLLWLAVKMNFLNPGPYLFWFTVGGSYIIRGTAFESTVFVVTAIGALIASKIAMAVIASRFLPVLESRGYLLVMKFLAATMAVFGLLSIAKAVQWTLSGALVGLASP